MKKVNNHFKHLFLKYKKILFFLPIIALLILSSAFYFKETTVYNRSNLDLTLPTSDSKELSDNKLEVLSSFEDYNSESKKDAVKNYNLLENDIIKEKSETNYEIPNKEVLTKVDKLLKEINSNKPSSKPAVVNYNTNNYVDNTKIEITNSEIIAETKENFNDFFETATNHKSNYNTDLQSDELIYAVVKGDHIGLKNRGRVTLILSKDAVIKEKVYKKNTLLYASSSFSENRVNLNITSINQVPVNLQAYDAEDGGLGLHVKNSLLAEASTEVVDDQINEIDVNGIPIGRTVKNMFRRKKQEPKIDLLNNQKMILKINSFR